MLPSQSSLRDFALQFLQNNTETHIVTDREVAFLDNNVTPSNSHLSECLIPSDVAYMERQQSQASESALKVIGNENIVGRIGSVLSDGKLVCDLNICAGTTFARLADLKRHHITLHAVNKPSFWCHVLGCRRSVGGSGGAFRRKDKLNAHVRKEHS